ncbi:MAG TPA: helix-turn-helix domain-containing protein [Nocardioides sp.]|nr:helix-turn-helix domain-containing protein [Nocardioides sp.]
MTDPAHLAEARDLARNGQGRRVRERSGVSLEELAAAVGVSVVDVMAWELGEREPDGAAAVDYVRVVRGLTRQTGLDGA